MNGALKGAAANKQPLFFKQALVSYTDVNVHHDIAVKGKVSKIS